MTCSRCGAPTKHKSYMCQECRKAYNRDYYHRKIKKKDSSITFDYIKDPVFREHKKAAFELNRKRIQTELGIYEGD